MGGRRAARGRAAADFAADLSRVGDLSFTEWCAREDHTNRLVMRSDYRQPFGAFAGTLPGGSSWRPGTA